MNHADVRARMADYLEGQLPLTDRALLDAHLDACPECSADIAEMRATIALLRGLPEPRVPGDFTANVMRRIRTGEATPGLFDRISDFFQDITQPRVLVPVSAALLSAGFVLWGQQVGFFEVGGAGMRADRAEEATRVASAEPRAEGRSDTPPPTSRDVELVSSGGGAGPPTSDHVLELTTSHSGRRLVISFEMAPSPYPPESARSGTESVLPAPVPFRSDWGGAGSPGSVAVASRPSPSLGEARSQDGPMSRVAPQSPGGLSAGTDATRGELRSRDDWLQVLEESPAEFAERLSQLTLAEQELWIDRLARHASEQGSLDRVVERLRSAGGDVGRVLADDFAAVGESAAR